MSAPFYKFGLFGDEVALVVAFVVGIGFGFFLERAGFGSARKLAAQFYLHDLAVFKVMFTAIVTAALGVFYLGWSGALDLSLVYLAPTRLGPQLLGGVLLGFGFVLGGYCPGTSVVAISTGRIDGFVFALGVALGIFGFGELSPSIQGLLHSIELGAVTIPDLFGIRYGVVLLAVVGLALAGFRVAPAVERRFARPATGSGR